VSTQPSSGWRERCRFILVLFVALRLMMLATFPADNLTLYGDYPYYYELARYSEQGYLPFIHYWSEHLPVFPFLSVGVYQLAQMLGGGYHVYVYLLGLVMLAVGAGNLVLLMRLARRLRDEETAERLGWVYSLLFVPLINTWWTFDELTAFTILLTLDLLLSGRERWSAVAMGLGGMTKLVPLLVFPAVMRSRPWRCWMVYGVIAAAVMVAVAAPLLVAGGEMARASFLSPAGRSSWETVWALLDGNLHTGLLGSSANHFDPATATTPVGHPARVPEGVKLVLFGLVYGVVFWQADWRENPRRIVTLVCFTLVLFFLWSKGWSPQWQTFLFPLLLLVLPLRRSLLFILASSFVNLAEWPVLLSRGMNDWLYLTVGVRTALFVLLLIDLGGRLGASPRRGSVAVEQG